MPDPPSSARTWRETQLYWIARFTAALAELEAREPSLTQPRIHQALLDSYRSEIAILQAGLDAADARAAQEPPP